MSSSANSPPAMNAQSIGDPDLAMLQNFWTAKCNGRTMPSRADINPNELRPLLPDIFILEIHQPQRFFLRLVGTRICERWQENITGKWLHKLDYDGVRATVLEQYASVVQSRLPRCDIAEFVGDDGKPLHFRRLLLPLSEDGVTPNMLLGMQKALGMDRRRKQIPKWI